MPFFDGVHFLPDDFATYLLSSPTNVNTHAHKLRSQNKDIKKNIRAFSGYPKSMPASEKEKRVAGLEKRMLAQLKDIATWLDLETSGTKVVICCDFACPQAPTRVHATATLTSISQHIRLFNACVCALYYH